MEATCTLFCLGGATTVRNVAAIGLLMAGTSFFNRRENGRTDLWVIREKVDWWRRAGPEPVQLTVETLTFFSLSLPSGTGKLLAQGGQKRGGFVGYMSPSEAVPS